MTEIEKWQQHYEFLDSQLESFKTSERELRAASNKKERERINHTMDTILGTVKSYIISEAELFVIATNSNSGEEIDKHVRSDNFQELLDKKVFTSEVSKVLGRINIRIETLNTDSPSNSISE